MQNAFRLGSSYVLNNPLAYTDPTGHSWWTSFRNSFFVPFARQVTTVVIASILVIGSGGSIDPYSAMMIGGFTSSAIFGGNIGDNVSAGITSAMSLALGNSEFPSVAKDLLQAGVGAINNGARNRASPAVSGGANTVTGSGFQTVAFQRLFKDESYRYKRKKVVVWEKIARKRVLDAIRQTDGAKLGGIISDAISSIKPGVSFSRGTKVFVDVELQGGRNAIQTKVYNGDNLIYQSLRVDEGGYTQYREVYFPETATVAAPTMNFGLQLRLEIKNRWVEYGYYK